MLRGGVAISNIMRTFAPSTSPDGGIGRRDGLKHRWSNPSRFDPGSGYIVKAENHMIFSLNNYSMQDYLMELSSLNRRMYLG